MEKQGNEESRLVVQYHYVNWPEFSNPPPNSLISFRRRFREDLKRLYDNNRGIWPAGEPRPPLEPGPPIVHCNNGGHRYEYYMLGKKANAAV